MKCSINPLTRMFIETGDQGHLPAFRRPFPVPSHDAYGLVGQPKEPNSCQVYSFMKADVYSQHKKELANEYGSSNSVLSA